MQGVITDLTKSQLFEMEEPEREPLSLLKPKHTKKDYEQITKVGVGAILNSATIAPKKKEFKEDKQ